MAKLTNIQVAQIRFDLKHGVTQKEIVKKYGICQSMVSRIKNHKARCGKKHLPKECSFSFSTPPTRIIYIERQRNFWGRLVYLFKGE